MSFVEDILSNATSYFPYQLECLNPNRNKWETLEEKLYRWKYGPVRNNPIGKEKKEIKKGS